ncbi:hypothetical protein CEF21_15080 [Bacillus sp. FJAT-42376]|uniref:hypothetical protein n=1 Tax=Bacillus sp. FJAT-42376 TaxID=2014076 RepID=UPI000F4FC393|nr:hypothetical protein [Bacillus sp. FJAT-42376]AZB43519.1 hypothetical protein CEF21_15080 [Bacillus sp. FJAT-42376]
MVEIQDGNTKIIIYSEVAAMSDAEHAAWIKEEKRKGNPLFENINRILSDYFYNRHKRNDSEK